MADFQFDLTSAVSALSMSRRNVGRCTSCMGRQQAVRSDHKKARSLFMTDCLGRGQVKELSIKDVLSEQLGRRHVNTRCVQNTRAWYFSKR